MTAARAGKAGWPAKPLQVVEAIRIGPEPRLELTHGPWIVPASAGMLHAPSLLRLNGYPRWVHMIRTADEERAVRILTRLVTNLRGDKQAFDAALAATEGDPMN